MINIVLVNNIENRSFTLFKLNKSELSKKYVITIKIKILSYLFEASFVITINLLVFL